jgi:hypothetical protein
MEATVTKVKAVFILLFFLSDVGKYRIIPLLSPNMLKLVIKATTDIRVVAIPTCSGLKSLALIIQKKNPKKAMIAVLNMRYIEFLYKESPTKWL